jgi:hypothetical protein
LSTDSLHDSDDMPSVHGLPVTLTFNNFLFIIDIQEQSLSFNFNIILPLSTFTNPNRALTFQTAGIRIITPALLFVFLLALLGPNLIHVQQLDSNEIPLQSPIPIF